MDTVLYLGNGNTLHLTNQRSMWCISMYNYEGVQCGGTKSFRSEMAAIEYMREQDKKYAKYCERCGRRLTANDIEDYGSFCESCVENAGGYDNL